MPPWPGWSDGAGLRRWKPRSAAAPIALRGGRERAARAAQDAAPGGLGWATTAGSRLKEIGGRYAAPAIRSGKALPTGLFHPWLSFAWADGCRGAVRGH